MKLTREDIKNISSIKNEPSWMLDFRLNSYEYFINCLEPSFGPKLDIDYDSINYYKKSEEELTDNWDNISSEVRDIFDNLGVIKAEKNYLDGMGAQYDSEVIYHNMIKELEDKNVIFLDTDSALKKYPALFLKYFNKLVNFLSSTISIILPVLASHILKLIAPSADLTDLNSSKDNTSGK